MGSGINEKRRELINMMKFIEENQVQFVLAEYKDRIARFGFEYISRFCESHHTEIELVESQIASSLNEEMIKDMIAIITSFSARIYGSRGVKAVQQTMIELEKTNEKT